MFSTSFEYFSDKAASHQRVVVVSERLADRITPVHALEVVAKHHNDFILLDSSDHETSDDACVYIGLDPYATFKVTNREVTVKADACNQVIDEPPYVALKQFFQTYRSAPSSTLAKFGGGMMGSIGYEAVRFAEPTISSQHCSSYPLMQFSFYRHHIVFDKRRGTVIIATVVEPTKDLQVSYDAAIDEIDKLLQLLHETPRAVDAQPSMLSTHDDMDVSQADKAFKVMVDAAKAEIKKGEIFQVVLSRTFSRPFKGRDIDVYRALRLNNPSPYQFLIHHEDYSIVGASPEKLASLQDDIITTCPMAGTRSRGKTHEIDSQHEEDLLSDQKEIAEHMMLVDLARNDIGKISEVGSVKVSELKHIKKFSRVMHISSTVQGRRQAGVDAFDVLQATLPAGTLSGAPKVAAMSLIDQYESSSRDLYGGAIVAIDNRGNMDSCITIRFVQLKNNMACVRAGCGIVFDSDPQGEADETRHKAQAILEALSYAEEIAP